ncbi:unnamed protein product [Parnassius apollo]|uniref:(apollo) hypothetical protein n=1 Tax=Parnassius apollo TaxID=110799 RepID=A0A8S3W432_PARAO|nr:unnamed protein product [Parnassius apollo]
MDVRYTCTSLQFRYTVQSLVRSGRSHLKFDSRETPREIRNKAEKKRRDKMNRSIAQLAAIVPSVVALGRKVDKNSVLKLSAHFLRAHQHVFGDAINSEQQFKENSARALLGLLKGFILTTTYKGLVVVVSENVQQYLGYTEMDLIGESIFNFIHEEDHQMLREQLMPKSCLLRPNGELLIPESPDAEQKVADILAKERRRFIIRFKKLGQRSEPRKYVTCHVEGTMRKSDKACRNNKQCCRTVRRIRARRGNPCSSGNDVVFVGLVRPTSETFISDNILESFRMEYRTRHSIDGEIIDCDSRISLVTGYMKHEVKGVNAMNFMHRDNVRWVVIALREMYDNHRLVGESCYRLMTKNGDFIYMQTKGFLDVDQDSRAVRSFVCTNTVVDEQTGKRLIKLMKKRFMLIVNNSEENIPDDDETGKVNDNALPVEDPKELEKVILHLVTNLPSPQPESPQTASPDHNDSPPFHLSIIPPQKERIVNAIEKIYSVIKTFNKEPISKMKPYKAIKENEQRNYEEIGKISNETLPTTFTTTLTSVSVTDVDSYSVSRLLSLDNTSLQRPNSIFRSLSSTSGVDVDLVSPTSFSQSSSTFIPQPEPSGFCSSVDPILLERFYSTQIVDDSHRYGGDSYAFEHYNRARSPTHTNSVMPEKTYTSVFTNTSIITSNTNFNSENIVNRHINMYSNTLILPSFSDRNYIIPPSSDSTRLLQISSGNHHLLSLNNDSYRAEKGFSNYVTPLGNYFSPISSPSTSYPSAITDSSSTFVADAIYPNYEMIIPTDTSTVIDKRYKNAHSLYDTVVHTNRQLMENYGSDEQNKKNNQPLPETVTSNRIDYLEKKPMIVAPTSSGNKSDLIEAKQLTHELAGYIKSNMEPSISSEPIRSGVSVSSTISCGTKRRNDFEDIDEIAKKKIALDMTVRATDSFEEESILCAKYLDNDELTESALEQELNSAFPELTPNEEKKGEN